MINLLHSWRWGVGFCLSWVGLHGYDLPVSATPESADDLIISDQWDCVLPGQKGYVRRADLAKMPTAKTVTDRIWPSADAVEMTVVPVANVLEALGVPTGQDGMVLKCADRWESWLPFHLVEDYDPYLLIYYEGRSPTDTGGWPTFLGIEDLAPYYVFVSPERFPEFVDNGPFGMISATQIVELDLAREAERYAPFFAGKLAGLSGPAAAGRELFLARCNTCHQGPGGVGGNVSQRPFIILQTHAVHNADHFRNVVADPKQFYPETIMPRHPDFEDEHYAALIAFITATVE